MRLQIFVHNGKEIEEMPEDNLNDIALAISRVAHAIKPSDVGIGHDEYGNACDSLAEAVMGVNTGLKDVADAIREVANEIRDHGVDIRVAGLSIANVIEKGGEENAG